MSNVDILTRIHQDIALCSANDALTDGHNWNRVGHTLAKAMTEIERLRADRDSWADQANERVKDCVEYLAEIERLRLEADEDDAALAAAGYLHDKLSSLVRRFYRQCEDANVWFPMDTTLMRDAKRALGDG